MANGEAIEVMLLVTAAFERLNIAYFAGGSVASSVHGLPRSTQDVDLVAQLTSQHVQSLVELLGEDFYADPRMMHDAIARQASFNLLHFSTMFKVDVFIFKPDALCEHEMARCHPYTLADHENKTFMVASAEDIILQKLHWYNLGNRVSDRQWNDVLNVIKVNRLKLDHTYLEEIAGRTRLDELLAQALNAPLES